MKKGMKKLLTLGLTFSLAVSAAFPALAGQWKFLEGGESWQWWYEEDDGSYPVNTWKEIDSKWYHFDENGYLDVGWHFIDGKWYSMEDSGAMMTGTVFDGGRLGSDGAWVSDRIPPENYWVCSEEDEVYWINKMEKYGLSGSMFVDNGDGTYVLSYQIPDDTLYPDFIDTVVTTATFRFNGFTYNWSMANKVLTFNVFDVQGFY